MNKEIIVEARVRAFNRTGIAADLQEVIYKAENGEIGADMPLFDAVKFAARKMGNPTLLLTNAQLEREMIRAFGLVVEEMKSKTTEIAAFRFPIEK